MESDYECTSSKVYTNKQFNIRCDRCVDDGQSAHGEIFLEASTNIVYHVSRGKRIARVTAICDCDKDRAFQTEECKICILKEANAVFYKCGHSSVCFECASRIRSQTNKCPFCKSDIEDIIRTYKS